MCARAFTSLLTWFACGVALVAVSVRDQPMPQDSSAHASATTGPTKRALLIGVTSYPSLGARHQLDGPSNDVALVRDMLLAEPFSVPGEHITLLVEDSSARRGSLHVARPTRANIEREFRRLAEQAGPGNQIVVMFAGHGSQQPDESPGGDEDDGLDEILLPSDVGRWDGGIGSVDRAIVDDELGQWVTAIRNKGAFVWVLVDACQSTSATRGSTEVHRTVSPRVLGITDAALSAHSRNRGGDPEGAVIGLSRDAGDIAALYAAQTVEPTPEKKLPEDSRNARVHGLFTYTLVQTIQQASGRLTYRDLVERIIQHYRGLGRVGPTPASKEVVSIDRCWAPAPSTGRGACCSGRLRTGARTYVRVPFTACRKVRCWLSFHR